MTDFTQPSSSAIPLPNFALDDDPSGVFPRPATSEADTRLALCPGHRRRLESLAEMSYPFEACGVLAGRVEDDEVRVRKVWAARNVGRRVRDRFRLDPEDFLAADRRARQHGLEIVGIWHSHPNRPPVPSRLDLDEAWDGYSYLILGVDPRGRVEFRSWRRETRRDGSKAMLEERVVWKDDPFAALFETTNLEIPFGGES